MSEDKRGDMVLYRRALRGRWPIPDELKIAVLERMARIVVNSRSEREAILAAKVLIAADTLNLDHERFLLEQFAAGTLAGIEERLYAMDHPGEAGDQAGAEGGHPQGSGTSESDAVPGSSGGVHAGGVEGPSVAGPGTDSSTDTNPPVQGDG